MQLVTYVAGVIKQRVRNTSASFSLSLLITSGPQHMGDAAHIHSGSSQINQPFLETPL